MKKILFSSLLLAFLFLVNTRCSIGPDTLDLENIESEITTIYEASVKQEQLHLDLVMKNQENKNLVDRNDVIDLSDGYRLRMDPRLKEIARDVMNQGIGEYKYKSII